MRIDMRTTSILLLFPVLAACNNNAPPGVADTGVADSGIADSALTDIATNDSGARDSSAPDAAVGRCPATGACDVRSSMGCDGGQGCYLVAPLDGGAPATTCLPAGTAAVGDPCTNGDDCVPGAFCNSQNGRCARTCCATAECGAGNTCIQIAVAGAPDAGSLAAGFGFCQMNASCDVVTGTGCPNTSDSCYLTNLPEGTSGCFPTGTKMYAADVTCGTLNECARGHTCVRTGDETAGHCRRLCNPAAMPSTCPTMETCRMVGGLTVAGLCLAS